MSKLDKLADKQYFFGALFVTANRLDTIMERNFAEFGVTTKQWFLSIVVDRLFEDPPTMKQAAYAMGSSHQNIKQLALKLHKKGLLRLDKDAQDARLMRLSLTPEGQQLWHTVRLQRDPFQERLFEGISAEELKTVRGVMERLLHNIDEMDCKNK